MTTRLFSGIYSSPELTRPSLSNTIDQAVADGARSIWAILCDGGDVSIYDIPEIAKVSPCPLLAMVMPGFIVDEDSYRTGFMILGFRAPLNTRFIHGLDRGRLHIESQLEQCLGECCDSEGALVVVDGLSPGIELFVRSFYDIQGANQQVIGGGVGYPDFRRAPTLADSEGVYQDSAVILSLPVPVATAVRHGWEEVEGPFLVTQAEGNVIHKLNYQPAFEVYSEVLQRNQQVSIDAGNFSEVSSRFPFGLRQLDSEILVRDPFAVEGDSLVFVGEIQEHSLVYVLTAEKQQLIDAAASSAQALLPNLKQDYFQNDEPIHLFAVDCVSRAMFLGEDFATEIKSIRRQLPESVGLVGLLTLGELVSSDQGSINFLNKTIVLGGMAR